MKTSSTNARNVGSGSSHKFPWKWNLTDLEKIEKNGLKVFSTFACGGGSSMGYKLAGYEVIGNVEIDPAVIKIYRANHHPKYSYLMDVREFLELEEYPEELLNLDILDGSPPCFVAGTKILTRDGYKDIENIKVGDYVWTHKNRFQKVYSIMSKQSEDCYRLKAQGVLPITVTGNHPFLVRKMTLRGHAQVRTLGEPEWKSVRDLEITKRPCGATKSQDYLGLPIVQEEIPFKWNGVKYKHNIYGKKTEIKEKRNLNVDSESLWYLAGRFVGDGWRRHDRKAVIICCGKDEREELEKIFNNAGIHALFTEEKTTFRASAQNVELYEFLGIFGDGAGSKSIPKEVLELPKNLLKAMIEGYLSADGHFDKKNGVWRFSSVSYDLVLGFQAAIAKVYGQPCTIVTKDNSNSPIEGREVTTSLAYDLAFRMDKRKQQHSFCEDGYLWVPFRKLEKVEGKYEVFNMSVEEDESYTVFNLAVHNCSSFSTAGIRDRGWGKEKVFREGQKKQRLDDLFFSYIEIAKRLQPKVCIAENVKGLVSGKAKGYVNEIIKAYDEAGYEVQLFLFNAATMGVPQRRERVFFIARRKDLKWPKLKMVFNEPGILFEEIRSEKGGKKPGKGTKAEFLLNNRREGDVKFLNINKRLFGTESGYGQQILSDKAVAQTITSGGMIYRMVDGREVSKEDLINLQTFPQDYDFGNQQPQYICGMSVPPVMMAQIASQVYEQWFKGE